MERDRTPIYVEYHDGRPFDVITADGHHYDFEWCKRDQTIYYNLSGFGSAPASIGAPRFCHPKSTVRTVRIWLAEGLRLTDGRGRTVRKHESRGYRISKRPPGDPFDGAIEESTRYCRTCKDYLPDNEDHPCWHIWWCDDCRGWGGDVDSPECKHRTAEAARAAEEDEDDSDEGEET